MLNYFITLGLSETADGSAIDAAYENLSQKFKAILLSNKPSALLQASEILTKLGEAHEKLKDPAFRASHAVEVQKQGEPFTPEQLKPLLGHVCVAAGIITYKDLMEAVTKQTDIDLPLGQILQERGLLSQTELEGMLMGQKLYGAPAKPLDRSVKQLLSLGLITLDMLKIALIDQRTSTASLDELISKRGWVDKSIVDALK